MGANRVDVEVAGVRATKAQLGAFEVQLLTFPPNHRTPAFDVEKGYLVVVLAGAVAKSFRRVRWTLARNSLALLPAGAAHTSDFARVTTTVLAVRARNGDAEFGGLLGRLRHVRAAASTTIGARIAGELRAHDQSWPLAAEGLVLQLLATAGRADPSAQTRRPAWLRDVRDLLHERTPASASLSELAGVVGVHPAHLARSFRRDYGVTVGQYARELRLEWATSQLARPDLSLAEVAAGAGFADQSHFTRSFRSYAGVTPGRYRELVRS